MAPTTYLPFRNGFLKPFFCARNLDDSKQGSNFCAYKCLQEAIHISKLSCLKYNKCEYREEKYIDSRMRNHETMNYLLGDSDIAARRLELVAKIFSPSTKALLQYAQIYQPDLTLDLGCGPGYTTRLLARVLKGAATIGLDNSENFLAEALRPKSDDISFCQHDLYDVPFPAGPADVIYCRYVLLHLENPNERIKQWTTQLKKGGVLILEELEQISASHSLFQQYLKLLDQSLAAQGKTMFTGPGIAATSPQGAKTKINRVTEIEVSAVDAAAMFWMNMLTLRESPHVKALYREAELEQFAVDLKRVANDGISNMASLQWRLRQIVLERT